MLVFGTRPEAIKMAPIVWELKKHPSEFKTVVTVTGQHRHLLDQVLDVFNIEPDYDLNIMKSGQDLTDISCGVLTGMRDIFKNKCRPDIVLVHGDTSTSVFSALASFYAQIPVGHVEAGLRTHNIMSPWPEEMNRQVTARIASLHFAPTVSAFENLRQEGIDEKSIEVTGNTVIDALMSINNRINSDKTLRENLDDVIKEKGYDVTRLKGGAWRMILITGHRRENFGEGFRHICEAIKELATRYPDVDFVYPMHLNPNVRQPINEILLADGQRRENLFLIEPLEYQSFVRLMGLSYMVLTDSGGIQEEAPSMGKPVLVMRDTTERPDALDAGTARLVGTSQQNIVAGVSELLDNPALYREMSQAINPYGDGKAAERIVNCLR